MDLNRLITVRQAAELLDVVPQRIRALIAHGRLKAYPINSRMNMVVRQQVVELGEELAEDSRSPRYEESTR